MTMPELEEYEGETVCGSCGATIAEDDERNFAFSSTGELCWDCAMARSGTWDPEIERWTEPPDIADLLPYED
jgi:hypothetical protein